MPIEIPTSLEPIFSLPGEQWSDKDQTLVVRWIFEVAQLKYLLRFCLAYLGSYARAEDAEDIWGDFCASRLPSVIRLYDPEKGRRFWNYLLFCLQRECIHRSKKLAKKSRVEQPLEINFDSGAQDVTLNFEPVDNVTPSDQSDAQALLEELQNCMEQLSPQHRAAFTLVVLQELDYNQASQFLSEQSSTIRVWVYRARAAIRRCLSAKGWSL